MRMPFSRRSFLGGLSAAGAAIGLTQGRATADDDEPLAILGGTPVRKERFTSWPIITEDERGWMDVLRKKNGIGSTAILPTNSKRPGQRPWVPSIAWPSPTARVR